MKLINKILITVAVAVAVLCIPLSACSKRQPQEGVQQLNYAESTEKINNPDQGFYHPIYLGLTENSITDKDRQRIRSIVNKNTRLYHLRIDISAFSKAVNGASDKRLTQAALDGLDELLSYLKLNDKNAIVRFAYAPSFGDAKDMEPALSMILEHIGQICPVLNKYENTITAIEAGLIGPWGEMHSSKIANADNISPIIEAFLTNTTAFPVLVRTPKMIYNYLGITINDIDGYSIPATHKAYRLGLFNDGYLGSDSDLGTYTNRQKEIAFISGQTGHLPFGGEVVIPNSPLHDIETCLPEMHEINLNYLNVEWNDQVIKKWKESYYTRACGTDGIYYGKTAFRYIENHLGYRFVLTKSTILLSENKINVELALNNVGFGNLNRVKRAKLILTDEDGNVVLSQDLQNFTGSESFAFSAGLDLADGNYGVYLRIYGEEAEGTPLYCLQFANDGLWNTELKANKIGSVEIK